MEINFCGVVVHLFLSVPSTIVVGEAGMYQDERTGSLG
jgi:hypothetical protein